MPHVPLDTMIDYVRGLGSAAKREEICDHLNGCESCAGVSARLGRLAAIARADARPEPPEEVVDAAIALFRSLPARENVPPDLGQLVFDSADRVPFDAASPGARLLRFSTPGDIDLELLVTEGQTGVSVSGHVTARRTGGPLKGSVSAHRESGQRAIASTRSTDTGEFRLDYAPPAAALLRFVIAGVLTPIHIHVTADAVG